MKWKVVRLQPSCAACLLSDDFEGQTDGSETFPNGVVGAKRTVRLRIKPFLGKDNFSLGIAFIIAPILLAFPVRFTFAHPTFDAYRSGLHLALISLQVSVEN